MAVYKLTYFNLRARGEVSRLLFAAAGKEYEDCRITFEEWPSIKPTTPLGQVPVLSVNGKLIPQSRAIERYLAREFGLYGKTNMENTMCDIIIDTIHCDVRPELRKYIFEKDEAKKTDISKHLAEEVLHKFMLFIEKTLKENGGNYLVGNDLTWADLAVFDFTQEVLAVWKHEKLNFLEEFNKHHEGIKAVPKIKKWLETRPKTER
ncbi:prostaglandin-H2 D-isomerase / glutathione transferase [Mytilus galloprovincialis]|uniref:Prostaglandin-H2 D-isomerase / glutathione transferase n=1 Tax=Mytilus galloprovincialis TaxID=29158 RepID=A0A8B6FMJ0_MYTGA|nr:prostaglandin-H2 D-isomerase / glutathione transferase [Mytilus galloprovincialis]